MKYTFYYWNEFKVVFLWFHFLHFWKNLQSCWYFFKGKFFNILLISFYLALNRGIFPQPWITISLQDMGCHESTIIIPVFEPDGRPVLLNSHNWPPLINSWFFSPIRYCESVSSKWTIGKLNRKALIANAVGCYQQKNNWKEQVEWGGKNTR